MARLSEHQGKSILAAHGIPVPRGIVASTPAEAERAAAEIGGAVVVKIQAWTTGRAAIGGIAFANTPAEARDRAAHMLGLRVGHFPVTSVLVEERLSFDRECFVSFTIDDRARAPVILFSAVGGSGIEERAAQTRRIASDCVDGPDRATVEREIAAALGGAGAGASFTRPESGTGTSLPAIVDAIMRVFETAKAIDARSLEINPLVITKDGGAVAADCRITIDDYAVGRHPELGIEIAREFDHPPTELERVAYAAEQADHRGTFYFAQLATEAPAGSRGLVGFHGSGGGGSMMAMDALVAEGFTPANFTDTSGNPSSAKVYRAARCILSQPGIVGYFGSGSGVASQEQFWSAYGLAKAFCELELDVPAVIRLGGNTEDRAVEVLQSCCRGITATIEGYRKGDPPAFIARRFAELVTAAKGRSWVPRSPSVPDFVERARSAGAAPGGSGGRAAGAISFDLRGGRVWIDAAAWPASKALILANAAGLLKDDAGRPALAVTSEEFAGKDSEMIACEMECRRAGQVPIFVELDMPAPARAAPRAAESERPQDRPHAPSRAPHAARGGR